MIREDKKMKRTVVALSILFVAIAAVVLATAYLKRSVSAESTAKLMISTPFPVTNGQVLSQAVVNALFPGIQPKAGKKTTINGDADLAIYNRTNLCPVPSVASFIVRVKDNNTGEILAETTGSVAPGDDQNFSVRDLLPPEAFGADGVVDVRVEVGLFPKEFTTANIRYRQLSANDAAAKEFLQFLVYTVLFGNPDVL